MIKLKAASKFRLNIKYCKADCWGHDESITSTLFELKFFFSLYIPVMQMLSTDGEAVFANHALHDWYPEGKSFLNILS